MSNASLAQVAAVFVVVVIVCGLLEIWTGRNPPGGGAA